MLFLPIAAYAQSGSPFDTGFTALQTLFTGTIAKVASLIAIVIGGYPWRSKYGASHRMYFDTPPLKGYCQGTLVTRCERCQILDVSEIRVPC
jgi:TrbC/VIRB2 pilin